MRVPDLGDIIILGEDLGTKAFDSKWTPIVLAILIIFCAGMLVGIELIRAVGM